jgi:hypothetical protein
MQYTKDQWVRNYKSLTVKMTDGSIIKRKVNVGEGTRLSRLFKITQEIFIPLVPGEGSKKVFSKKRSERAAGNFLN